MSDLQEFMEKKIDDKTASFVAETLIFITNKVADGSEEETELKGKLLEQMDNLIYNATKIKERLEPK
jgi:hypothetical protein